MKVFLKYHGWKLYSAPILIYLLIHFYAMIIYPSIHRNGDWSNVYNVWHYWQTLNAGIIALVASMIALYSVHRINSNNQNIAEDRRKRKFIANLALLPQELSGLSNYCVESSRAYKKALSLLNIQNHNIDALLGIIPHLNTQHILVFKECIEYGNDEFGKSLTKILVELQIHNSKMQSLPKEILSNKISSANLSFIYENIKMLVELLALINKLFHYSRRREYIFNDLPLTLGNLHNAIAKLELMDSDGFEGYNDLLIRLQVIYNDD